MLERRYEIPKVKDVFPVQDSIFSKIVYDFGISTSDLDIMFFSDFGLKTISPIVSSVIGESSYLTNEQLTILGRMLLSKYKNRWDHLKAVCNQQYDPIHNYLDEFQETIGYEDEESASKSSSGNTSDSSTNTNTTTRTDNLSESVNSASTRTDNLEESSSNSSTRTDNLSESTTIHSESTGSNDSATGYYGLNSATSTGVDDTSGNESSESDESNTKLNTGTQSISESSTITNTGTQGTSDESTKTNTGTQTTSDNESLIRRVESTSSESNSVTGSGSKEREGYHRGNIGNISTQKLLKEEIELWKWNFVDEVLHDARDFLTIRVYSL